MLAIVNLPEKLSVAYIMAWQFKSVDGINSKLYWIFLKCSITTISASPCGWGVEYVHRFPSCCMRWLKGFPDGSASTASDYVGLLCNLYRDAGPKWFHHSQTSCAHSSLNPSFYTWCNMLLTGLHNSTVISISLLLTSISSILPFQLSPLLPSLMCFVFMSSSQLFRAYIGICME